MDFSVSKSVLIPANNERVNSDNRTMIKKYKYKVNNGLSAVFINLTYKITVPLAFLVGGYGILSGIAMDKNILWIAGIIAIFAGWFLKIYVEQLFKRIGKPMR